MTSECSRARYPIMYNPAPENTAGVFAVMTLMSEEHYAIIVCIDDPNDEEKLDELSSSLARAFWNERHYYVRKYSERLRHLLDRFAVAVLHPEYEYTVLPFNSFGFVPTNAVSITDREPGTSQYVFIAEPGVLFEEFVFQSSMQLN